MSRRLLKKAGFIRRSITKQYATRALLDYITAVITNSIKSGLFHQTDDLSECSLLNTSRMKTTDFADHAEIQTRSFLFFWCRSFCGSNFGTIQARDRRTNWMHTSCCCCWLQLRIEAHTVKKHFRLKAGNQCLKRIFLKCKSCAHDSKMGSG